MKRLKIPKAAEEWIFLDTCSHSSINRYLNPGTIQEKLKHHKYWPHALDYDHGIPSVFISLMDKDARIGKAIVRENIAYLDGLRLEDNDQLIVPRSYHLSHPDSGLAYWGIVHFKTPAKPKQIVVSDLISGKNALAVNALLRKLKFIEKEISKYSSKLPCLVLRPFTWPTKSNQAFVKLINEWRGSIKNKVSFIDWETFYYHIDHSGSVHLSVQEEKFAEDSFVDWYIWSKGGSVHNFRETTNTGGSEKIIPLSLCHGMKINHPRKSDA